MQNKLKTIIVILLSFTLHVNAQSHQRTRVDTYKMFVKSDKRGVFNKTVSTTWKSPQKHLLTLSEKADQGEVLTFKIGIWAKNCDLKNVRITAEDFVSKGYRGSISKSFFSYSDIKDGQQGTLSPKAFVIKKGNKKILYGKIKVPKYISPTTYSGKLHIETDNAPTQNLAVNIAVSLVYVKGIK